jgi:hypothetical protein
VRDGRPWFDWPSAPETIELTLAEVDKMTRRHAALNIFMLADGDRLTASVDDVPKRNGGRVLRPRRSAWANTWSATSSAPAVRDAKTKDFIAPDGIGLTVLAEDKDSVADPAYAPFAERRAMKIDLIAWASQPFANYLSQQHGIPGLGVA